jgi:predicted DNA-binding protein
VHVRQATSLRVDRVLYDRLADLARSRQTSISRQLEQAIRHYLEAALVKDHAAVIQPAIERVIQENLEACISQKIDEMKDRLAGLLAKQAVDGACVYLLNTYRLNGEELASLRREAARHVRGHLSNLQADIALSGELERLRGEVNRLTVELQARERTIERLRSELEPLQSHADQLRQEVAWHDSLLTWLSQEWGRSLLRRRPLQQLIDEYQRADRHPRSAQHGSLS